MSRISLKAPASNRAAFRVAPDPDDPIILQLDGKLSRVLDISATGFSSPPDIVEPGRRYPFSIDLPTASKPLTGYVDVLPEEREGGPLHCRFVNLSPDELDQLHHYALVRQKEAIRSFRTGRAG